LLREIAKLKTFSKGRVIVYTTYPDHSAYLFEDRPHWKDFNPDAGEEFQNDLPVSKGPNVRMIVYVDADHAHDLVTRRSITGILLMFDNATIRWVSKHRRKVHLTVGN
jgi:hypothetical protein